MVPSAKGSGSTSVGAPDTEERIWPWRGESGFSQPFDGARARTESAARESWLELLIPPLHHGSSSTLTAATPLQSAHLIGYEIPFPADRIG